MGDTEDALQQVEVSGRPRPVSRRGSPTGVYSSVGGDQRPRGLIPDSRPLGCSDVQTIPWSEQAVQNSALLLAALLFALPALQEGRKEVGPGASCKAEERLQRREVTQKEQLSH